MVTNTNLNLIIKVNVKSYLKGIVLKYLKTNAASLKNKNKFT